VSHRKEKAPKKIQRKLLMYTGVPESVRDRSRSGDVMLGAIIPEPYIISEESNGEKNPEEKNLAAKGESRKSTIPEELKRRCYMKEREKKLGKGEG